MRNLVYLISFVLSAALHAESGGLSDRYAPQRGSFEKVLAAQSAGRHKLAGQLALGLEEYPLYPYYVYNDLRRRLHHHPSDAVARFLSVYDNSFLSVRLREEWLTQLSRAGRWQAFLDFYRPSDNLKLRCLQLTARLRVGVIEGLLADTQAVWLHGKSLPDECDPAFARLYKSARLGDDLLWQRMRLAMQEGNAGLAGFLGRRLESAHYKALNSLRGDAHGRPAKALARKDIDDDADARAILLYALKRLCRSGIAVCEKAWAKVVPRYAFSTAELGDAAVIVALAAARKDHPRRIALLDAVPDASLTTPVQAYRIREGILTRSWAQLARWTRTDPPEGVSGLRWRYWRARALDALGEETAARAEFEGLAQERDYYGFLAADQIGTDYRFHHAPVAATPIEFDGLMAIPGVPRARELYLLGRKYQARREWAFELSRLDKRQLETAASVAAAWNWPDRAIFALGKARSYDDLEMRFPLLYADVAQVLAARRKLEPARVMAITRSESAFISDARSGAGALGLMQLMPATAREMARQVGAKFSTAKRLYNPKYNLTLGTAYLAQMLKRFDGNFAMATAAYNAGPHRVRQWQKSTCTPADIWIDSIPFTETRRYVRRAYFYTAVYQWRMHQNITRMAEQMPAVLASGLKNTADCKI